LPAIFKAEVPINWTGAVNRQSPIANRQSPIVNPNRQSAIVNRQ
jgi:hypothetical protein